jgi:hypothetical protein
MMQKAMAATLIVAMGFVMVQAQTPAPANPPAAAPQAPAAGRGGGRGGPPLVTPEVKVDNTVTFRFRAPNAQQVTLIGELDGKTYPMTKDEAGVWSVTIGPLAPDVYNYQFNVDGVIAMDPVNPAVKLGFGNFPPANMFEIPGDEFDDAKNVPHGTVRVETYHSKTMGVPRTIWVYTPAGLRDGEYAIPGVLSAARIGQHRQQLDADRPRQLHHGQPDRRGKDEADDHRQSARLRPAGRQPRTGAPGGERADRSDRGDRRRHVRQGSAG